MRIRPAGAADSAELAILDDIAGHGLPSRVWAAEATAAGLTTAMEYGRQMYLAGVLPCSWRNAQVAVEDDGRIAGMAVGYLLDPGEHFEPPLDPAFKPVYELFSESKGCWLLDALAVYTPWRGKGVAGQLLDHQITLAGSLPFRIVCADDNKPALSLYGSRGFGVIASRPFVTTDTSRQIISPVAGVPGTEEWLLLERHES